MPAAEPLPTLEQLTNAYQGALVSERDFADTHEGSVHDHWAGAGAVMWRRLAERDAEEFRAGYFNGAKGTRLDEYIDGRFPGKSRIFSQRGVGSVKLKRPSAAAGAGTFWAGTRIAVGEAGNRPITYYLVKQNTACAAGTLETPVAIEAAREGTGSRIAVHAGDRAILRVEDPLWDNSWTVQELTCDDGTLYEDDDEARSRITAELFEERFGYESLIIKTMKAAGAGFVVLFRSDYLGDAADTGLNRIYVSDANLVTTPELLKACRLALPSCAMVGAGNQALAITKVRLTLHVGIRFWAAPESCNPDTAVANARGAVVEYFERENNAFAWSLAGIRGAVQSAVDDTQSVEITSNVAPPVLAQIFATHPLPRYSTDPNLVSISLEGPAPTP
jgi:hypothetical protein